MWHDIITKYNILTISFRRISLDISSTISPGIQFLAVPHLIATAAAAGAPGARSRDIYHMKMLQSIWYAFGR